MNKPRIAFFGTPEFAVPCLDAVVESGYDVCAVFTQPDRPKGRGHKLTPPPVKARAAELGIPVYQHEKISRDGIEDLKKVSPDLMVTVAYGQILSQEILDIPPLGCINVHASLLPKLRGAAPIEWAVINGDETTGVTTMYTVYELDAGDMLEKTETAILPEETGGELRERLSKIGAETLIRTLEKLTNGTLVRTPQDETEATVCKTFPKGFGKIDFSADTASIINLVRGLNPAPVAYAVWGGKKVKIFEVKKAESFGASIVPGEVILADAKKGLFVNTGDGAIEITRLQMPGGKQMSARDYLRGAKNPPEKFD